MPAITVPDLNNAKIDVDHIAAIAKSLALTAVDRDGNVKPTLSGILGEIQAAIAAANALMDEATGEVALAADIATTKALEAAASALAASISEAQAAAIVLGDFLADGTGAVARTFTSKARDIVSVFDFMTGAQAMDVRAFTYTEDVTAALQAALDTNGAAGKTVFFPKGGYYTGRLLPKSKTTPWIDGGSTLRKKVNGTGIFRVADGVDDVHIYCNGATLDGETSADAASSHTVYFTGAKHCGLYDAHVLGAGMNAGVGKDCIYIGGDLLTPSEFITIRGGSCTNGKRQGISIVSGRHIQIDGVEISGTTGTPGAGIDIEANDYEKIGFVEIKNCKIHGNIKWGIVSVFGAGVHIHHNEIYGNGEAGIAASVGGAQWDAGKVRSNVDIRAITAVAPGSGQLTITGGATLEVGTLVVPRVRGAGVLPTGLSSGSTYFVASKDASNSVITLSSTGFNAVAAFSDAGSGTLTSDPTTSEIFLRCYVPGQSSDYDIHHNKLWGNSQVRGQIDILHSVHVKVHNNEVDGELDQSCMSFTFCRDVSAKENRVKGNIASTSATARGIHFGSCAEASTYENRIRDCSGAGLSLGGLFLPGEMIGDRITNCGMASTYMLRLENMKKARIVRPRLRSDPAYLTTYGIGVVGSVEGTFVTEADCQGVGSSNANSILLTGTGNKKINCTQFDGTLVNT